MKKRILTSIGTLATIVVIGIVALSWRELTAWYVYYAHFEKISAPDAEPHEYLHRETGIVFEIGGGQK